LDVVVDIRARSPTFGKYVSAKISAQEWNQIFVPIGFAHGFMTLEPNTEVVYKVTARYSADHDRGLFWLDADLAIEWPQLSDVIISEKDRSWPCLRGLTRIF
jgi:dTDP-4-dehydrorhamnose 3,5-epimerase